MANRVLTTDAEIDAALERARRQRPPQTATSAKYDLSTEMIIVELRSGRRLGIPREDMQGLADARRSDVADIEILGIGAGLHWPKLDASFSIEGLIKGRTGNQHWMQFLTRRRKERERAALSKTA